MARIILDMDSTITDLCSPWFALYNAAFGDDLTIDRVKTWNTALYCKGGKAVYNFLKTPGLFRNLKPHPHAIDVIGRLYEDHEIYIGTAVACEQEKREKLEWLAEHLPFISRDRIKFTEQPHKNGLVENADLLFDDGPHNLKAWEGLSMALRYPYNEDVNTHFVNDWIEFEREVRTRFPVLPLMQRA